MIKNILLISGAVLLSVFLISGTLNSGGSAGKYTGSPIDGKTCTQCHSSFEVTNVNWIETNIPESGWIPSETYNITLTGRSATAIKMGFEITAENGEEKVGTFGLTDEGRMRWTAQDKAVTHTSGGTVPSNGTNTWNIEWTAPADDKGEITFYAAVNAANGNGNTSGDSIFNTSVSFAQAQIETGIAERKGVDFRVFPNPASNMVFVQAGEKINSIRIFSVSGKQVARYAVENSAMHSIQIGQLNPGNYVISAKTQNGNYERKLMVQ